jgi:hypothetical protein
VGNIDTMPDLPLSPHSNMVSKQGLAPIDALPRARLVAASRASIVGWCMDRSVWRDLNSLRATTCAHGRTT